LALAKTSALKFQFEFNPNEREALTEKLNALTGAPPVVSHLRSVYLDTLENEIHAAGLAYGFRHVGEAGRKAKGKTGSRVAFVPFFEEIGGAEKGAAKKKLKQLLKQGRREGGLCGIFRVTTRRQCWTYDNGRMRLRLMLDQNLITVDEKAHEVGLFCLVLEAGTTEDVLRIAHELAHPFALPLAGDGLAARGYLLVGPTASPGAAAAAPKLVPEMSVREAFEAIVRECLGQFLANEPVIRLRRDAQAVHQARIAVRRLRSALQVFKHVLDAATADGIGRDLKELGAGLGRGRDLDVLATGPLLHMAQGHACEALVREIERRREAAYDKLIAQLVAPHYRSFHLDLVAWIATSAFETTDRAAGRKAKADKRIVPFMARRLEAAWRRLARQVKRLPKDDTDGLHRIRIAAKNLRYAVEFCDGLVKGKSKRKRYSNFLKQLKALQARLGDHQDKVTAMRLFKTFHEEGEEKIQPDLRSAAETARSLFEAAEDPCLREEVVKICHRLAAADHFWTDMG